MPGVSKKMDNQQFDIEDLEVVTNQLDLFSEEMEDHFNAGNGSSVSTSSTAFSCWSTLSSICSVV